MDDHGTTPPRMPKALMSFICSNHAHTVHLTICDRSNVAVIFSIFRHRSMIIGRNTHTLDPCAIESISMSEKNPSPLVPIVISILAAIGWCVFILWYTFFWSSNFSLFQNLVVGLISLIIVAGVTGSGVGDLGLQSWRMVDARAGFGDSMNIHRSIAPVCSNQR